MTDLPFTLVLMGPTASGKTALSLKLVEQFPFEIISVDSALVYRSMDIGTSKPSTALLDQHPHHLINICDPSDAYSVASFRNSALKIMADIVSRDKIPLLVGGTMLYFRALFNGISKMPSANTEIRASLETELAKIGLAAMHKKLQQIDPAAAEKIHPNDPQRIQRALEVFMLSSVPISEWWKSGNQYKLPYKLLKLAITTTDRKILHERIAHRFVEMLEEGFVEEVKMLKQRGDLNLNMPSMRCVGYRQIWQHLDGEINFDEMKFRGIVATRQLAKRQLTWLRSEQNLNWFYSDEKNFENNVLKIVSQIPRLS